MQARRLPTALIEPMLSSQRVFLLLIAGIFILGCPPRRRIWVAPGSTMDKLEFTLSVRKGDSTPINTDGVTMFACLEKSSPMMRTFWSIVSEVARPIHRLQYGVAPAGFRTEVAARPLLPGCYEVAAGNAGSVVFQIDSIGNVKELRDQSQR